MHKNEIINEDLDQLPEELGTIDIPQQFHQLGIFVLDGSGSMSSQTQGGTTKAGAVNDALRGLLTRFKISKNKNDFSFAVVTFASKGILHTPITTAVDIDDNASYDPINKNQGYGTDISSGLDKAKELANKHMSNYQEGGAPHSVIILTMTDGADGNPSQTIKIADEIKNGKNGGQITICSAYFGEIGTTDDNAKNHLRAISSDSVMGFKEVYDAETLRSFFIKSISAASNVKLD